MKTADTLLSLVLKPADARSLVGDLVEEIPLRGRFWFWRQVFQTMIAGLVREVTTDAGTLIRIGIDSIGVQVLWLFIVYGVLAPVFYFLRHSGLGVDSRLMPLLIAAALAPTVSAGIWSGRRAIRHEVPAGILSGMVSVLGIWFIGLTLTGYLTWATDAASFRPLLGFRTAVMLVVQWVAFAAASSLVRIVRLSRARRASIAR